MIRPHLVILGTGFGAFSLIKATRNLPAAITVVSPRNHFLFTPLLASTTVGTLEFRSVIESVRLAGRGDFLLAEATSLDMASRTLHCKGGLDGHEFDLPFDLLVISVGAITHTFNIPGVTEYALFLKQISDARLIRQRIFECLERASLPGVMEVERKRLLRFVIVGGGPTGVEFAAELHDLAFAEIHRAYPHLVDEVKITLVDSGKLLLSSYDKALSEYTLKHFQRQAIEVLTQTRVMRVEAKKLLLQDGSDLAFGLSHQTGQLA